jgi:hypothetical protein
MSMPFLWPVDRSDLPPLPDLTDPPSDAYVQAVLERNGAENIAVAILHWLSGRQFGLDEQTVRPCRRSSNLVARDGGRISYYLAAWAGTGWVTTPCGCVGGCTVGGPRVVHLPGPVHAVTEVKIADVVLAPNVWVVEGNALYRREANWPRQDLGRPLGEVDTWSVTYQRGIPVPPELAQLTGLLTKEILDALNNEGRCRLPRTVTVASRNGVSYRAYDPAVIYASGKTGIPEIDIWLAGVNPHALMAAPTVL